MAAIVRGIFTGEEEPEDEVEDDEGEVWPIILPPVTHLGVQKSVTVIRRNVFCCHPNIVELICHDGVIKIEADAFYQCLHLERLVLPGVEEVGVRAFSGCKVVHVECDKLELIGRWAFSRNISLESIDLPSAKIVERGALDSCAALTDVKFGKKLESIGKRAFCNSAVKRITMPLKSGLFTHDDVFMGCDNLSQVFLLNEDEATMQETVGALLLEEWKKDMNEVLDSINQTLPNADAGEYGYIEVDIIEEMVERAGGKTSVIRDWMERVLQKIIHYKVEHYRLLSLAAVALAQISPNEVVINNMLSWLQLPDHVFEGEGDSSATTPALDRQMWENVVQMKQKLLENDMEITSLRSQCLKEKDKEIAALKALNDEKEDENHHLQVANSGGVIEKNDAVGLSQKRPRRS